MGNAIRYAYFSMPGRARANHEDNFYIEGNSLEEAGSGMERIETGEFAGDGNLLAGVFDGMGGESAGETAACLAAQSMGAMEDAIRHTRPAADEEETWQSGMLEELCRKMNDSVCRYASDHRIRSMGSTAAYMILSDRYVSCANVGDSRIYRVRDGLLQQLSVDHIRKSFLYRKGPLTQYLGVEPDEMILQPHIVTEGYGKGTVYLLCTDGVTDMLDDEAILALLSSGNDPAVMADRMREEILSRGAADNATMMILLLR